MRTKFVPKESYVFISGGSFDVGGEIDDKVGSDDEDAVIQTCKTESQRSLAIGACALKCLLLFLSNKLRPVFGIALHEHAKLQQDINEVEYLPESEYLMHLQKLRRIITVGTKVSVTLHSTN